jgi:cytochrome c oxidase subunit II
LDTTSAPPRPAAGRVVRRLSVAAMITAAGGALAAAPVAAGPITPDSGGTPNAEHIDTLYRLALYIGLVVFLIVEGTLGWSI